MKKKVLVMTGGGTAGHVLPCLALLPFLKPAFPEVHFIGSNDGFEEKLVAPFAEYHGIDSPKFSRGNILKALPLPFKLWKATRAAKKLLDRIKPDVIFSKGGYVALPVVLAAKRLPVYAHESDVTMGLANKLSVKRCRTIFTSFDVYRNIDKAVCTGSPIRREIYGGDSESARRECGFGSEKPVLLVTGGSSGAAVVNDCLLCALDGVLNTFDVIHVTGEKNPSHIQREGYFPITYTSKMADFLALADFVVTRGGSGTLFELMALKKPSLIIPLPKGISRGDQIENAEYFCSRGAALTLPQARLTPFNLIDKLRLLVKNADALKESMAALKNIDGTEKIARFIIETYSSGERRAL